MTRNLLKAVCLCTLNDLVVCVRVCVCVFACVYVVVVAAVATNVCARMRGNVTVTATERHTPSDQKAPAYASTSRVLRYMRYAHSARLRDAKGAQRGSSSQDSSNKVVRPHIVQETVRADVTRPR